MIDRGGRLKRKTLPSFALLKLGKDGRLFVYFYRYKEGAEKEVDIEKVELKAQTQQTSEIVEQEEQPEENQERAQEQQEEPTEETQDQKLIVHSNLQFDDSGSDDEY